MIIHVLADWLLPILLLPSVVLLLVYVPNERKIRDYSYIVMAGLTSLLIGQLVSMIYQPEANRPFVEKGISAGAAFINNPGFPSDHVLLLTVVVMAVIVMVRNQWLSWLLVIGVVLVGVGRVLAQVHTPLDVIGGAICGLSGGIWYLKRRSDLDVSVDN